MMCHRLYQQEERMNAEDTDTPWLRVDFDAAIDLQLHTTFSDGRWEPEELLNHVATEGFALVAVTDHDSPWTAAEIRQLGAARRVATVSAVEMTSTWEGQFLDLLCFGFDPAANSTICARRTLRCCARATSFRMRTRCYTKR
jgi:predicted metal-dependent phosphoesterase TrpH